jgi:ribokinase
VVATLGARGGRWTGAEGRTGTFQAAPLPGPPVDAYGCGDSFAAGLTFGLGRGDSIEEAVALAARCGAVCLAGDGPYGAQLRLGRDST